MRPLIGVTPLWRTEKEHLWMRLEYLEGVMEAGGAPVVFPFTEDEELVAQLTEMCDGIMFTGGHDISPSIYGEEPIPQLEDVSEQRDRLELLVFKKAMELHKPIFGICRGIQFLNAALGGTLYQDIPTQYDTEIAHHQSEPYPVPTHQVNIVPGSPLAGLLGDGPIMVNSFHHQAVKDLAPGLVPMAWSTDGLLEAFYRPGPEYFWAVQWHPEMLFKNDENSKILFRSFVDACKNE